MRPGHALSRSHEPSIIARATIASSAPIAPSTSPGPAMTNCAPPGRQDLGRCPARCSRMASTAPRSGSWSSGEGERAEPLPDGEDAIEAAAVDATGGFSSRRLAEPGAQASGLASISRRRPRGRSACSKTPGRAPAHPGQGPGHRAEGRHRMAHPHLSWLQVRIGSTLSEGVGVCPRPLLEGAGRCPVTP